MKKLTLTLFLNALILQASGQFSSLAELDKSVRKYAKEAMGREKYKRTITNFKESNYKEPNNTVVIYTYSCGEIDCIRAFVESNGSYKELLYDVCTRYSLNNYGELHVFESSCCGESPFVSNKTYKFHGNSVTLTENYVETSAEYTKNQFLTPPDRVKSYSVKVLNDNYNLRFSPTVDTVENPLDDFLFTCDGYNSNIIAKIKINSIVNVLGKYETKERIWLYVEVEKQSIKDRCNVTDFEKISFMKKTYQNQKIRGWISGNYVEKTNNL